MTRCLNTSYLKGEKEAKAIIGKEGAVTHIIWERERLCVLVAWKMFAFCLCSDKYGVVLFLSL